MELEYTYKMIELQEGLPIRLVMHRQRSYSYHWHKELEIFVVLQGSVYIKTTKNHYTLHEGEILIMNSNEIHASHILDHNDIVLIIQMDMTFCKQFGYDFTNIFFKRDELTDPETIHLLKRCVVNIVLEIYEKKIGFHNEVMSNMHHFISLILRQVPYTMRKEAAETMSEIDFLRLNRIISYINENYSSSIALKDVAKEEYLSVYYLSHFFKKKVGITFTECLNQVRIQKATELMLSNSSMNLIDIALSVGFPNVKSYHRNFKNKYQMSPFRYKKKMLDQEYSTNQPRTQKYSDDESNKEIYNVKIMSKVERLLEKQELLPL